MKNRKLLYKIIGGLLIISLLLGIWITYRVNASTEKEFTVDDCPYDIEFTKMDSDFYLTMAIDTDGYLWGWGHANHKVFGDGKADSSIAAPKKITDNIRFKDVAVTDNHILAIDTNGYLWSWGNNCDGQLGNGTATGVVSSSEDVINPQRVSSSQKFIQIAVSDYSSMAIDASGYLWAWGDCTYLGIQNTTGDVTTPQIVSEEIKFSKIKTSGIFSLAIDKSGNLWSWGNSNCVGLSNQNTPRKINLGATFSEIAIAVDNCYAIDSNGDIWSWGSNRSGQLGNGTTESSYTPTKITQGKNFTKINCENDGLSSEAACFAIDSEGKLWSWGENSRYWLGNKTTQDTLEPQKVMEEISFKDVTVGQLYAIGIDTQGRSWSWGFGTYGATATPSKAPYNIPIRFTGEKYCVTFEDGNEVIKQDTCKFDGTAVAPLISKDGYTLSWDKESYRNNG